MIPYGRSSSAYIYIYMYMKIFTSNSQILVLDDYFVSIPHQISKREQWECVDVINMRLKSTINHALVYSRRRG